MCFSRLSSTQILFAIFLAMAFLERYQVGQITLSKIAVIPLFLSVLMVGFRSRELFLLGLSFFILIFFLFYSYLIGNDFIEAGKSALGAFSFISVLILLPRLVFILAEYNRRKPLFLLLVFFVFSAGFVLDSLFGLNWSGESPEIPDSWRPYGLSGEPSWFAITIFSLSIFIYAHINKLYFLFLSIALLVVSRSSIGIMFGVITLAYIFISNSENNEKKSFRYILFGVSVFLFFMAPVVFESYFMDYYNKLINPLDYGSGHNRFVQPLEYLMLVWDERPLFGRGFTFFEQYVQGNSAAAVLFLPVFWELGIGGVLLYFMFILTVFYGAERPGFSAIMALGILVSMGLPYSTFQATALVLVLTALKIKKSLFQSS